MGECGRCGGAIRNSYGYCQRNEDCAILYSRAYDASRGKRVKNNPELNWSRTLNSYNIDAEMYYQFLKIQGGGCYLCGKTPEENGRRLSVDHDHACCPPDFSCGFCIRGLLCTDCNQGLGNFHDNPEILQRAITYLELRRHSAA